MWNLYFYGIRSFDQFFHQKPVWKIAQDILYIGRSKIFRSLRKLNTCASSSGEMLKESLTEGMEVILADLYLGLYSVNDQI